MPHGSTSADGGNGASPPPQDADGADGAVGADGAPGAEGQEGAANPAGEPASASQPNWTAIEEDLRTEVDASNTADDENPEQTGCGAAQADNTALGILVVTSDTNEFVGNANVELTKVVDNEAEEDAGGGVGGSDTGGAGTAAGSGDATAAAEENPPDRPADMAMPTDAQNGSAIWNPFTPADTYDITIPVLPEDYADKYSPPTSGTVYAGREEEYQVTVENGDTVTKIVFIHPKPWIEIKLLGSDGEPAKGHAYRLELPLEEGANPEADPVILKEGTLDDDGFARITEDDVAEGTILADCHVTFPAQAAEAAQYVDVNPSDYIKLELLDTLGQPAKNWRYELYAAGEEPGEPKYQGTLDAIGSALVMVDDEAEQYEVVFRPPDPTYDEVAELAPPGNWVGIEMLDGMGQPAANWRYEIAIVGKASTYTGTLDAIGQAMVPVFVGEDCEITFAPPLV